MALYYYNLNGITCVTSDIANIPKGVNYHVNKDLVDSDIITLNSANTLVKDVLSPFLNNLKQLKTINKSKFNSLSNAPYTDSNGVVWNGGQSSVASLNNAAFSASYLGKTTLTVYDLANQPHTLSISEVQQLAANINDNIQSLMIEYQDNKNLIDLYLNIAYWQPNTNYSVLNTLVCDYAGQVWSNNTVGTSQNNETIFPTTAAANEQVVDGSILWTLFGTLDSILAQVSAKVSPTV
jgi:hypothetical protein